MGEEPVPEEREVQMPGVRISVLGCVHLNFRGVHDTV